MKKQLKQGKKYGFNYEEEKRIYKYACDSCKKREIKKLSEDRKFNTYLGWKEYVWSRYSCYDKSRLIDFLHFLRLKERNTKPVEKLSELIFAASYGFIIAKFSNIFLEAQQDIENIKKLVIALIFTVIIIVLIGGSFFLITNLFMGSISSNNMDRNMYEDYINIIQEIIQSKENEEKLK
jgi:predicted amino acid-binding ACT domain protein